MVIMAHGTELGIKRYLPMLHTALPRFELNIPLRIAHYLAQVGHESMSFVYTEEIASGTGYEGREDLGNTESGDGVRFKGRGLIQLTGRDNYTAYANYLSVDLLQPGNETLVSSTPEYALDVNLWFWEKRRLNGYADSDDLKAITRRVNGGCNGLEDRKQYLHRAKFFLLP